MPEGDNVRISILWIVLLKTAVQEHVNLPDISFDGRTASLATTILQELWNNVRTPESSRSTP